MSHLKPSEDINFILQCFESTLYDSIHTFKGGVARQTEGVTCFVLSHCIYEKEKERATVQV